MKDYDIFLVIAIICTILVIVCILHLQSQNQHKLTETERDINRWALVELTKPGGTEKISKHLQETIGINEDEAMKILEHRIKVLQKYS